MVEGALGGILFVDEAYALVSDDRDTFGKEVTVLSLLQLSRAHLQTDVRTHHFRPRRWIR